MRLITESEYPLISYLFESARLMVDLNVLKVQPMDDARMGSLQIERADVAPSFGRCVADCEFRDADGVTVLAALNADACGQPMEIDIWKVDFSALKQWPDRFQILQRS